MSDAAGPRATGLIGPNAVLQLVPVIERAGGRDLRDRLLAAAGIAEMPSEAGLMPEMPAARLHRALREVTPDLAPALSREAGRRTAGYILRHRIPAPAQWLLRALPAPLAAPLLARAIERHAWTFAGSGRFRRDGATGFEIADNPMVAGEVSDRPLCHWHAAVFETLYRRLVSPAATCREVACCAAGSPVCRFDLALHGDSGGPAALEMSI